MAQRLPLPISGTGVLYVAGTRIGEATYQIRRAPGARGAAMLGVVRPIADTSWKAAPGEDVTVDLCRDDWWWDCTITTEEGAATSRGRGLYRRTR